MKFLNQCCCGARLYINQDENVTVGQVKLINLWNKRHASCHKRMHPYPTSLVGKPGEVTIMDSLP